MKIQILWYPHDTFAHVDEGVKFKESTLVNKASRIVEEDVEYIVPLGAVKMFSNKMFYVCTCTRTHADYRYENDRWWNFGEVVQHFINEEYTIVYLPVKL